MKMQLKITVIISAVICVLLLLLTANMITRKSKTEVQKAPGFWGKERVTSGMLKEREEAYKKLMSLGYLQGYESAPKMENVTVHNKDLTYDGYNFYVSGHAPEAALIDLEGTILHEWKFKNAKDIWSELGTDFRDFGYFWRRAHLFENGDVLAIYNEIALIKIDKDSNLLWEYKSTKRPHHALDVTDDGTIYVITNEKKKLKSSIIDDEPTVVVDYITVLNPDGTLIKHVPLFDLLEKSKYRAMINYTDILNKHDGDIMHTNSIQVFDGRMEWKSRIFKKGNVMISPLWYSTIFIVDMDAEEIVWALGSGMWRFQHEPILLDNGNILIFNNIHTFDSSQVLEFDPITQEIHWEYTGTDAQPFFSRTSGSNQRLPNGNTLITETDFGRAFEVTTEGEIVWEFINPHRSGEKNELIATIPEMIRIEPDYLNFLDIL